MERRLVLATLNHYIQTSDMIFLYSSCILDWKISKWVIAIATFNKQIIFKGLLIILEFNYFYTNIIYIILEFNYFYTNRIYIHQIKGTAVGSNLVVAYKKIKMFALLPQLYPQDFINFFRRNIFWILDNVFHKWLENLNLEPFYNMINNLDLDLKLIVKNPSKSYKFS